MTTDTPKTADCLARLGWGEADNGNHFQYSDIFTYRICNAYNTLAYKWLLALVAMENPTLSTLLNRLSLLIHRIDGESCDQYHYSWQSPIFVGGRTKAAGHFRDHLVLSQHLDHMHMEHSALRHSHQTLSHHPSLFLPGGLDDLRSFRTGDPALLRNK